MPPERSAAAPARRPRPSWRDLIALLKDTVTSWVDDYAPSMGAAIAYYTVFSVAPLLLIVISVAGVVFGPEAARGAVVGELQGFIGDEGARAIEEMLLAASEPATSAFATLVGLVTLLIGATTVFAELQSALDRIWRAPQRQNVSGIWNLLRARVLSFGMILGIGFLLVVSLLASAALAALSRSWSPVLGEGEMLAHLIDSLVSLVVITTVFAMIYKIMPRVHVQWIDVWLGALFTSLLFTIGKFLIGLYIGKTGVASGYGAAGSLVVLLVWVYYSAQIFLLGAEFTWLYAHRFGSLRGQKMAPAEG
ncbi:membrane protein [Cupriavidus gilardii J11]|uniref:Membrane protein n=1 Tax=Cupriavidus gilardii J11 TaxID=936133 RepID=A0A562BUG0_9BURK|nr:YihY/virulence factor BrkB family protein [Cupriavidus gilardii]TWG88440.1 membrane protein [Cupriavidus gilardii J11]